MENRAVTEKVTLERWREAQIWERNHWINTQRLRARCFKNTIWRLLSAAGRVSKYRGDDWNSWWKRQFDNYGFLPREIENAIEVGCGPYTNVRLMLDHCRIHHLVLSDPLIRTYVRFKLTLVSEMYREAACTLDDHPLESLPFASNYFDLVVKINVLDHVQDAHKCMENLVNVVRTGGLLIVGQDLTNEEDMKVLKQDAGAVGHPIKLDHEWFEPFFKGFEPVIMKVLSREHGRDPSQHYGTLIFAGRKK